MAGALLREFYVMTPKSSYRRIVIFVMADPTITHTQKSVSKCNLLTRTGLHEIYVMTQTLILQIFSMYVMILMGV